MNVNELSKKLRSLNACEEALIFTEGLSLREAWIKCERGDWMLWLYQRLYPNNFRELTLAKGQCANTVRHLMKDKRSIKAVDTAIAYGEGKATKEELSNAADAAVIFAAYAAAVAYDAAADVAAVAATADADACDAVYADAIHANIAKKENQRRTADICRKYLKIN